MRSTSDVDARPVRSALEVALHRLDRARHLALGAGEGLAGHAVTPPGLRGDQGTHRLAAGNPRDVVGGVEVEHDDRQVVLQAQRDGRRVEDLELVAEQVLVAEARRSACASGSFIGSASYTPSTLVAFSSTSAPISTARSAAAVSVVKYGLPVPATKIVDAALLEVAHGAAADVRLGDLVHRDRAHDPRRDARSARSRPAARGRS